MLPTKFVHTHHHVQLCYPCDQECQLITWNKAPTEPLHGSLRQSDRIFADKVIDFAFTVMRVKGSVKWKYVGDGDGDSSSILKLQRWDEKLGKAVHMLNLGDLVAPPGEWKTLPFDFEYSTKDALWGPGEKGGLLAPF